jgi:serine/threonine protein kinase
MPKADDIKAKLGLSGPPLSRIPSAPPEVPDHELARCIGKGSYGEVWLARNAVGTWRAVKVVRRDQFKDARPYEREFIGIQKYEPFSRANEGLVDVLQIGRNDREGYFYYVMELADDASTERRAGVMESWSNGVLE